MSLSKCPVDAITSFPLYLAAGYTPTTDDYNTIQQDISLDVQFATRTTPPSLVAGTSTVDEGSHATSVFSSSGSGSSKGSSYSLSSSSTTMVLNNSKFTLYSVQIVKPTHTQWLPTNASATNKEDIVITFENNVDAGKVQYVVFVIPLLESETTSTNNYLQALEKRALPPGVTSISIQELMPPTQYIYYITCLDGYSELAPTQNVCTFVSVQGMPVSTVTMEAIRTMSGLTTFPNTILPYTARLAPHVKTMIAKEDLSTYVVSTTNLFSAPGTTSNSFLGDARNQLVERISTDAVKCTVLNPDTDIDANGVIRADINSGDILKHVIEQRNSVIKGVTSAGGQSIQSRKSTEAVLSYVMAAIMGVLLIGILVYFYALKGLPTTTPTTTPISTGPAWYSLIPVWVYVAMICLCLACYMIGALV